MNRIIFITGATSGIGKACAKIFAKNGDKLIINGRRKEKLEELKKLLEEKYTNSVLCAPFDVSQQKEVAACIQNLPEEWQQIDVLVNSAGLALGKDLFNNASLEDWDTMLDTNVKGLLYVSKAVIPVMIKNNKGHIFNLGSVAGDDVYECGNVYNATKAAVATISTSMRVDLLKHGIKVTNIKPGAVDTEFSIVRFKGDKEKAESAYKGYTPLLADDVANTIYYCASLPANVCINDLTITCTAQANGIYFFKQ